MREEGIPGARVVPEYSPLLLSEFGRKLVIDATWTSTLSWKNLQPDELEDDVETHECQPVSSLPTSVRSGTSILS